MPTKIDFNNVIWTTAGGAESPLYLCGPSHNAQVVQGDSASAQIQQLGMGSELYFGDGSKFAFAIKEANTVGFSDSTFLPVMSVDRYGRIKAQSTGNGNIGGNFNNASWFMSGTPDGQTMYIVLDITNNTSGNHTYTPTLILSSMELMNFRFKNVGNNDVDQISWDAANKYIQVVAPSIQNIFVGIKACFTTQHFFGQTAFPDILSYLNVGDLPDTFGPINGNANYLYSQYAETANKITINAHQTGRFVWCIAYRTTQAALQSFMGGLTATPTSDLATADAYFQPTNPLTINTPDSVWIPWLFDAQMGRHNFQSHSQIIATRKIMPAGSYTFTYPFARDGYYGAKAQMQMGGGSIVTDEYQLFKTYQNTDHSQQHEIPQYVNANGLYIAPGNNGTPGDQDCYQILKAYEYYIASQDGTFLTAEIANLNAIGNYLLNYYNTQTKWVGQMPTAGATTYLDGEGNITGTSPMHDPLQCSLYAYTMLRLSELNTVQGDATSATTFTNFATSIMKNFSAWYNPVTSWLDFNRKTDGTQYTNKHLTKVDAGLWGILDPVLCANMAKDLITNANVWWDGTNFVYNEMPTTDPLYNAGDYWYGKGWNFTMFKAIEFIVRYGTASQAQQAWTYLKQFVTARMNTIYGQMAEHMLDSGLFEFGIGAFIEMMVRGFFGIDTHATYFTINPNLWKIGKYGPWKLTNLTMGNQQYTITASGQGQFPLIYVNNVLQTSNKINYGGGTAISIVFSGRQVKSTRTNPVTRTNPSTRKKATTRTTV